MRYVYNVLLYLLLPLVLTRLIWRSLRLPGYRRRIKERFGNVPRIETRKPIIWIHAVSVGEVQATRPLIDRIRLEYPAYLILVTTYTPTGAETVEQVFADSVIHRFVPFDLPVAVSRFISRISPEFLIVMETEIWPNLFRICNQKNIPVILVNARLSESSLRGYMYIRSLIKQTLEQCAMILAQTKEDAQRFGKLGVDGEKLYVAGNLKFDCILEPDLNECVTINGQVSGRAHVWIAASTHDKEEEIILAAHRGILDEYPDCLLIIAPRHPERSGGIFRMAERAGFEVMLDSTGSDRTGNTQVYILDVIGKLPPYYAVSDIAFIGGSLVPVGGHNMLEPASLGIPVLTGPYTHNFTGVLQGLIQCGAARVVMNADDVTNLVKANFRDENMRLEAGESGKKYVEKNRGGTAQVLDKLRTILEKDATSGAV